MNAARAAVTSFSKLNDGAWVSEGMVRKRRLRPRALRTDFERGSELEFVVCLPQLQACLPHAHLLLQRTATLFQNTAA